MQLCRQRVSTATAAAICAQASRTTKRLHITFWRNKWARQTERCGLRTILLQDVTLLLGVDQEGRAEALYRTQAQAAWLNSCHQGVRLGASCDSSCWDLLSDNQPLATHPNLLQGHVSGLVQPQLHAHDLEQVCSAWQPGSHSFINNGTNT